MAGKRSDKGNNILGMTDEEITYRYTHEVDIKEGLRELGRLRKIVERASTLLQDRIPNDNLVCTICGTQIDDSKTVRMRPVIKDEETGTVSVGALCSTECVKQWNKIRMGLAEMVK